MRSDFAAMFLVAVAMLCGVFYDSKGVPEKWPTLVYIGSGENPVLDKHESLPRAAGEVFSDHGIALTEWEVSSAASDAGSSIDADISVEVIPVRARGWDQRRQAIYAEASGVALGGGRYATVAHLASGITSSLVVEVRRGGEWVRVTWEPDRVLDLAYMTGPDEECPIIPRGTLSYGDRCRVYGLSSGQWQEGVYVDPASYAIALDSWESGTRSGDSGGAVLNVSGELVGVLTGHRSGEPRLVMFSPIHRVDSVAAVPSGPAAAPQGECVNGVCVQPRSIYQVPAQRQGLLRRFGR